MTKEKAINELNDLKDYCKHTFGIRTLLPYLKSLDMAIEALKQESCEDAPDIRIGECEDVISRDDAKSFLYERLNRLNNDELYDIFSVIIDDMYNELPPVQPKSGWIPVSERLPERDGWYLISLGDKTYGGADVDMYCKGWVKYGTHVLAWMPLPKPYEADMRGEE